MRGGLYICAIDARPLRMLNDHACSSSFKINGRTLSRRTQLALALSPVVIEGLGAPPPPYICLH